MKIIFIGENEGQMEIINIPVVQAIEPITCDTMDEDFVTIDGNTLNLIGGKGLRRFSFSSFFLVNYIVLLVFLISDHLNII